MIRQPLLQRAIAFAVEKHMEQLRKGTTIPYVTHVVEAMEIVSRMTDDEDIRAAAVLHDTMEDAGVSENELIEYFNPRIAALVAAESEDKRADRPAEETWLQRKLETVRKLREASTAARMVALGDKLANVRAMSRDYQVIGEELWQRFNEKNPVKQGMYYGELANVFGDDDAIRETDAYREYVSLCAELFSKSYDGDGNLVEEDEEEDEGLPVRFAWADTVEDLRADLPEGTKVWALIFDRTEDPDLQEIQKMAATLDAFLRTEDIGFGDVHMQFVNEPDTDEVSWKRTEDGYALHLCVESGKNWCQAAFQLGYLMTHCLIDHLGDKEREITWAEELICEASTLKLLSMLEICWDRTVFAADDPGYVNSICDYIRDTLSDVGTSALLHCKSVEELKALNERNLFEDRLDESHDLYLHMMKDDLQELALVRNYEENSLLLDTKKWRKDADISDAVDYICRLQERALGIIWDGSGEEDEEEEDDDEDDEFDDLNEFDIIENMKHPDGRDNE